MTTDPSPANVSDVSELTPKEIAVCDSMTPDLVARLWREEVDGENELTEAEACQVDEFAMSYPDAAISPMPPEMEHLAVRRIVGFLKSYSGHIASVLKWGRRAFAAEKEVATLAAANAELLKEVERLKAENDALEVTLDDEETAHRETLRMYDALSATAARYTDTRMAEWADVMSLIPQQQESTSGHFKRGGKVTPVAYVYWEEYFKASQELYIGGSSIEWQLMTIGRLAKLLDALEVK